MLDISNALGSGTVKNYYRQEYSAAANATYYSEGKTLIGTWHGKLAAEFGLVGAVEEQAFDRLANGDHPHTGERLVGKRRPIAPPEPAWVTKDAAWREYLEQTYITALTEGRNVFEAAAPYKQRVTKGTAPAPATVRTEREQLLLEMHAIAAGIYRQNLANDVKAREYLAKRKISEELVGEFGVGVADRSGRQIADAVRGYGPELMRASGLFSETPKGDFVDRFRDRLMFPIQDEFGDVIAFAGRRRSNDDRTPKYINSAATELYTKGAVLFNEHRAAAAAAAKGKVIAVEGYVDAIAAHGAGVPAVALGGTAMTDEQAGRLRGLASTVVLNMDQDPVGIRATQKQIASLLAAGADVRVAALGSKDPAEFVAIEGEKAYRRELRKAQGAVAWLSAQAAARDIGENFGSAEAIRNVTEVLANTSPERRREVATELAAFLGTQAPERVKRMDHRAGWDLTFNAPKGVSLTAVVGGDESVRRAHERAVKVALDEVERYAQARMGNVNPPETTGKWIAAVFQHDTARPVDGYPAPHLHTHTVLFNMARTEAGKMRAVQPEELFRIQAMATAIYQNVLEYDLRGTGYLIERAKNHAPDIAGYTSEYLAAESPRSAVIKEEKEARGVTGREAESIIQHQGREEKLHVTGDELRAMHQANAEKFGNQPAQVLAECLSKPANRIVPEHDRIVTAEQCVTFARNRLSENHAVFEHWQVIRDALRHAPGRVLLPDVERELERQKAAGLFIAVDHIRPDAPLYRYTTPELIAIEKQTIKTVLDGRDQMRPIILTSDEAVAERFPRLNADQRRLVRGALWTQDRVFGIEGKAGTGKTTALAAIRELAEEHGYKTLGLGPTSGAVKGLKGAGIESETLQAYLLRESQEVQYVKLRSMADLREAGIFGEPKPRLFVLDESSLAAGKQMRDFLATLRPQDRVLLSGDQNQHESVEAGRIFSELRDAGMRRVALTKIVRQKEEGLREVVEHLSRGLTIESVEMLGKQGRIEAIEHRGKRFAAIAAEYSRLAGAGTVAVVTPDNRSRQEISDAIRAQLRREDKLSADAYTIQVLVSRQELTRADRGVAGSYSASDVIKYLSGSEKYGLKAKTYATVIATDGERNEITVKKQDGRELTYDPARLKGVAVYRPDPKSFAVGDRIAFTAPVKADRISTRDVGTVRYLDAAGNIRVELDEGKRMVGWNLKSNRHIDHGYVGTSHALQGATFDHGIVHVPAGDSRVRQLVNERMGYVAVSRFRYDVRVFTDSEAELGRALSRRVENATALAPAEVHAMRVGV